MQPIPLITRTVKTHSRHEMIDITARVQQIVSQENVREGMVIVYVPRQGGELRRGK